MGWRGTACDLSEAVRGGQRCKGRGDGTCRGVLGYSEKRSDLFTKTGWKNK